MLQQYVNGCKNVIQKCDNQLEYLKMRREELKQNVKKFNGMVYKARQKLEEKRGFAQDHERL